MKIWITGIAGFLGSHLAEALLKDGHYIYGNDNLMCGDLSNIAWTNLGLRFSEIDCCDYGDMYAELSEAKPDVLIHCAATAHEGLSNFSPSFITRNIYEASVATFSAAIAAGVKRIIFMSSMARYGAQSLPFHEVQTPHPIDPYGIAKVAAEDTLKALCKLHGVEYVIAVPHNIIGTRQRYCDPYRNVASIMINRALQEKPLLIYGDGRQMRCFSPIKDCIPSLLKMVDAPISGEIINIGPDYQHTSIIDLAEIICDLVDGCEIQHIAPRPNEVINAYCSSSKARKLLDFSPQQSLRECLNEMVAFIKERGTKPFQYDFPIEIERGCPPTWKDKLI